MDDSVALYVVATPIGNLEDITLRALDVLKKVEVVAAEDTRNTSVLFEKYSIKTHLISYHKFSEHERCELFLSYLRDGKSIALVSDAGTPLISDPGNILVDTVNKNGFRVIPVVGASAPIALLSSVSRQDEDFKFVGFLPRTEGKISVILEKNSDENLIFYESPQRLIETLEIIKKNYPDKILSIGRELTKKFEEIKTLRVDEMIEYYKNNTLKGELVCLIHKSEKQEIELNDKIKKLRKLDLKDKQIASIISTLYDVNKNDVYTKCLDLK